MKKNPTTAAVLGLIFGPLGLFYLSAKQGIVSLLGWLLVTVVTGGVAGPVLWISCAVWCCLGAVRMNSGLNPGVTFSEMANATAHGVSTAADNAAPVITRIGTQIQNAVQTKIAEVAGEPATAGTAASGTRWCSECGQSMVVTAKFCSKCGHPTGV